MGSVVERERPPRIPASEVAVVTVLPERKIRMVCRVADFSQTGIGLNCEGPIPVPAEVLVEMEGCIVSGEARYCRPIGAEYRVGLHLDQTLAIPDNPSLPVRHISKSTAG